MLKRYGGFKANAKIPPLLIPVIPCPLATSELCNGWFLPSMKGQRGCLHCLNHKVENCFDTKTTREAILLDLTVTWQGNIVTCQIIAENIQNYNKLIEKYYNN